MDTVRKYLIRPIEVIIAAMLAVMLVMILLNVVLRYALNSGITITEELSRLLFVWLVSLGAVLAAFENQHLGFDLLTARLPGVPRQVCLWLARGGTAYVMVLVAQGSWAQVRAGMDSRSTVIGYPLALAAASTLVVAVGVLAALAAEVVRHRSRCPHPPAGSELIE